jgi:hypothetical protein
MNKDEKRVAALKFIQETLEDYKRAQSRDNCRFLNLRISVCEGLKKKVEFKKHEETCRKIDEAKVETVKAIEEAQNIIHDQRFSIQAKLILEPGTLGQKKRWHGVLKTIGSDGWMQSYEIPGREFLLLCCLALGSKMEHKKLDSRYYNDYEIKSAVFEWQSKVDNEKDRIVAKARSYLKENYQKLGKDIIRTGKGMGYRIAVHPSNIKITPALKKLLKDYISEEALIAASKEI